VRYFKVLVSRMDVHQARTVSAKDEIKSISQERMEAKIEAT
jgi:hypothetical protein